jgi:hypothetical protein
MEIKMFHRNFSAEIIAPRAKNRVISMKWGAIGGPESADFESKGQDVWELIERLRCPIEIYGDRKIALWWGYISSITIYDGVLQVTADLERVSNRVRVVFSEVDVAGAIGTKQTTAWGENAASRSEFGKKESTVYLSQGTATLAENFRATVLDRWKYPIPGVRMGSSSKELYARVKCVGWWNTLDWIYYEDITGKESYEDSGSAAQNVGSATSNSRAAQSFQLATSVAWSAQSVSIKIKKVGDPTDNVTVSLCANGASIPGTVLASKSMAGSDLTTSERWIDFKFSSRATLSPATTYWILVQRSGSVSSSNYYAVNVNENLGYTRGLFKIYNGSSYVNRSPDADMVFIVGGVEQTSSQLAKMLSAGEFITNVRSYVNSGVWSCPYRDGNQYTLAEAVELINGGTSNNRRILAVIDQYREAILTEEPAAGYTDIMVSKDYEFFDYLGKPLFKEEIRPGQWARLKDVIPASTDMGLLADISRFFIESVEYKPESGDVSLFQRDEPKVLNFGGV